MTIEEINTIDRIINRAQELGITIGSRITQVIDMHNAHKQFHLRLDEMLSADDFDFAHDFCGIQANIDRNTGVVGNLFVPRFAGRKAA